MSAALAPSHPQPSAPARQGVAAELGSPRPQRAGEPLLEVQGLQAAYGSSTVLFGVDLRMGAGEVATLVGRNGMGKTTTVRAILGLTPPQRLPQGGSVRFLGERIDGLTPDRIARMGLAVVPEGRQVFPNLSVRENLLAFARRRHPLNAAAVPWTLERVLQLFPRLAERLAHMGHQLSGGEQQMLAIGRALMTNPHLLILDEATEGLAPLIREDIWRCLDTLRREGQTILVIDKYIPRLIQLADHHTILEKGRVAWHGPSAALAADPALWQRYLGV